jgi:hypothetical protein
MIVNTTRPYTSASSIGGIQEAKVKSSSPKLGKGIKGHWYNKRDSLLTRDDDGGQRHGLGDFYAHKR